MGIMDAFRAFIPGAGGTAGNPNPNATPQIIPGNNQQPGVDPSINNPAVPGSATPANKDGNAPGAIPKAAEGDKSPLEGYLKLWETPADAKPPASLVPSFSADPKKLMEAAKTIDFSRVIGPEVLQAAAKGDAEALGKAINLAAQAGYAQSAHATTKIVEDALTRQAKVFNEEVMPKILRDHSISTALSADNPIFDNPAVKPLVEMARNQLAIQYPKASPAEVNKHAQELFLGFATEIAKAQGMTIEKIVAKEGGKGGVATREPQDWGQYFGVDAPPT